MDGWKDCVAIKCGDKFKIAAGLFNPLILKTRKTTICFYPPAMLVVPSHSTCVFFQFFSPLPFPPFLSESIFLDPSVFTTPLSHSIVLFFYVSSSFSLPFFCSPLHLSRSGPLGNQRTWITSISPREQKLIWSSWEHTPPDTIGTVWFRGNRTISCSWFLWLACQEEMPIKYCCEPSKLSEKEDTDTQKEYEREVTVE